MVLALMAGTKSQTRRVVKGQTVEWLDNANGNHRTQDGHVFNYSFEQHLGTCPYGVPGDLLLVAAPIPGVPKNYCAGSDGHIYSKARGDWRPLKEWRQPKGYQTVTIVDGERKRSVAVHRLVCSAFYGDPPAGSQVRHLDGNPENGAPSNLAWGSQEDNWLDRRAHGHGVEGEKHHAAKFTDNERVHIRWALEHGLCSQRGAARALGVSQCAIQGIASGNELEMVEQLIPADRVPTIHLRITDVRVERLNDISEADARAEGCPPYPVRPIGSTTDWNNYGRADFSLLWSQINGLGSWEANPWVWALTFDVLHANVDTVKGTP